MVAKSYQHKDKNNSLLSNKDKRELEISGTKCNHVFSGVCLHIPAASQQHCRSHPILTFLVKFRDPGKYNTVNLNNL